jgi:hypothetical protein
VLASKCSGLLQQDAAKRSERTLDPPREQDQGRGLFIGRRAKAQIGNSSSNTNNLK